MVPECIKKIGEFLFPFVTLSVWISWTAGRDENIKIINIWNLILVAHIKNGDLHRLTPGFLELLRNLLDIAHSLVCSVVVHIEQSQFYYFHLIKNCATKLRNIQKIDF